jgi:hypothetical protein
MSFKSSAEDESVHFPTQCKIPSTRGESEMTRDAGEWDAIYLRV